MEQEWAIVKQKVAEMSRTMWAFENEEARKAYDHILHFMIICEQATRQQFSRE